MSFLSRISRVLIGEDEEEAREEAIPRLRRFYIAAVQRSRQMERHAELAPHESGRISLERLAQGEMVLADLLRAEIVARDGFAGEARKTPEPSGTLNYWGRLVRDLEAHRAAISDMLDYATELSDDEPELADFLRGRVRDETHHAEQLRALIARSDPQAID